MKLFVTICAVSWKSAVCHERNKDSLDKVSRGFQIETPFLSHVSGGAWNATPFWQLKIQPSSGVHGVGGLVFIWQHVTFFLCTLFNSIKSKQSHTALICIHYLRCFTLIESSPVPHGRRIREAWTKSDLCVHIFHLYAIKRQLGALFAIYIYTLYQILRHQL